jgi:hypothetical protein
MRANCTRARPARGAKTYQRERSKLSWLLSLGLGCVWPPPGAPIIVDRRRQNTLASSFGTPLRLHDSRAAAKNPNLHNFSSIYLNLLLFPPRTSSSIYLIIINGNGNGCIFLALASCIFSHFSFPGIFDMCRGREAKKKRRSVLVEDSNQS